MPEDAATTVAIAPPASASMCRAVATANWMPTLPSNAGPAPPPGPKAHAAVPFALAAVKAIASNGALSHVAAAKRTLAPSTAALATAEMPTDVYMAFGCDCAQNGAIAPAVEVIAETLRRPSSGRPAALTRGVVSPAASSGRQPMPFGGANADNGGAPATKLAYSKCHRW